MGNLSVNLCHYYAKKNQFLVGSTLTLGISILWPSFADLYLSSVLAGFMNNTIFTGNSFAPIYTLLTAIFIVILYKVHTNICMEMGGRPGTIGFFACFFSTPFLYLIGLSCVYHFDVTKVMYDSFKYDVLDNVIYIVCPFVSAFESLCVYWVQYTKPEFIKTCGKVGAYSLVCSYGSIFFQLIMLVIMNLMELLWSVFRFL